MVASAKGKPHELQELIQEVRQLFLDLGFDEVENPVFIPEHDVYKQYGKEAAIVLDRCYYLATLPRPEIGLSKRKAEQVLGLCPEIDLEKLKGIFRSYKEGKVSDLTEELVRELGISTKRAIDILSLFPEFQAVRPVPTKLTLRSHMTAAWFPTIQAYQHFCKLPLRLFSVGLRFRREQRVDPTHLRVHYGASCVVVDEHLKLEDCLELTREILSRLGLSGVELKRKQATSNYYEDGTEYEAFYKGVELADLGMYSRRALANYGIRYEVFNLGFGLERILMLRRGVDDVREVIYPQFYLKPELSDREIAGLVEMEKVPLTEKGREIALAIASTAREHANAVGPCEFLAHEGELFGRKVRVYVLEKEAGKRLLGPAALNEVYVCDGNVYGVPPEAEQFGLEEVRRRGIGLFSFLDAISNYFAFHIEEFVRTHGCGVREWRIRDAKTASDINLRIAEAVRHFIASRQKVIAIKGPIFMAVRVEVE